MIRMKKKVVSPMILTLLLSLLSLASHIQLVKASGTIYIRPDGSVEGTDKIQRDGDVYTFTDNIHDEIVVERGNIVIDGAGYTLQGTGAYSTEGINITYRGTVTIKNVEIEAFDYGILLEFSSNNIISGNNISASDRGIAIHASNNNTINRNNIVANIGIFEGGSSNNIYGNNITADFGVLVWSSNNAIFGNSITNGYQGIALDRGVSNVYISRNNISECRLGITLYEASYNTICGNIISNNEYGVSVGGFHFPSSNNIFYHNNFINNTQWHVAPYWTNPPFYPISISAWDSGYPSGGNYWSNYTGIDEKSGPHQDESGNDGIGDITYTIDEHNTDRYPLMNPWTPVISASIDVDPNTLHLMSQTQWITCYIELPQEHNVSEVDVSTILMNDTIPVDSEAPTQIGDYDSDGVPDLMVRFSRTMVSEFILSERITNGHVTLTITGEVDGTPFEGEDTIIVLMSGGGTRGRK